MKSFKFITLLLSVAFVVFLMGCGEKNEPQSKKWVVINGRDGVPIYRIKAPTNWRLLPQKSTSDSTVPIAEFYIDNEIRITIHNFPSNRLEERIPAAAQIARWERQFEQIDSVSVSRTPQAFSGFSGYLFEASGKMKGKELSMMGWAMQLSPELYRKATDANTRADYTIKAQGDADSMKKHRRDIATFARTFELINPFEIAL